MNDHGSSTRVKIVWISHRSDLGGAQSSLVEAAAALVRRGVAVEVVLPAPGPLGERLRAQGAHVVHVPHGWWVDFAPRPAGIAHRIAHNSRYLRPLMGALRASRPNVIVTNTLTVPLGALASRILKLPHIWYLREYGLEDHGLRFDLGAKASFALIRCLSDALLVNFQALRAHFASRLGITPMLAYCAADVGVEPSPIPIEGSLRLVQVGTLAPLKGQVDAVNALAALTHKGRDVRLRLVGPDPHGHAAVVSRVAHRQKVCDRLELVGPRDNPAGDINASHVALNCSHLEAFGRGTVEAMKLGRPVIGAAGGGTSELIRDGWNGFLYPPGDVAVLWPSYEFVNSRCDTAVGTRGRTKPTRGGELPTT